MHIISQTLTMSRSRFARPLQLDTGFQLVQQLNQPRLSMQLLLVLGSSFVAHTVSSNSTSRSTRCIGGIVHW
jgi:hypothetical protein